MNYALVVHSEFSSGKKTETKNTVIFSYQNGIINFQSRNPNYICAVHQDKSQSVTQLRATFISRSAPVYFRNILEIISGITCFTKNMVETCFIFVFF